MGAEIIGIENDTVTVEVQGLLTPDEWAGVRKVAGEVIAEQGKVSMLVLAAAFEGWAPGQDWDDQSFFEENDQHMRKIAIVGEERWREPVLIFSGQGFRHCLVEYFRCEEADNARAWLAEPRAD